MSDRFDPWEEIARARREADRLLQSVIARLGRSDPTPVFVPETDVVETEHEYRLYVALPGVVEDDIDITVRGDVVVVRGERESPFDVAHVRPHHVEWKYGYFESRHRFPGSIRAEAVTATFEAGALTVILPKASKSAREADER